MRHLLAPPTWCVCKRTHMRSRRRKLLHIGISLNLRHELFCEAECPSSEASCRKMSRRPFQVYKPVFSKSAETLDFLRSVGRCMWPVWHPHKTRSCLSSDTRPDRAPQASKKISWPQISFPAIAAELGGVRDHGFAGLYPLHRAWLDLDLSLWLLSAAGTTKCLKGRMFIFEKRRCLLLVTSDLQRRACFWLVGWLGKLAFASFGAQRPQG